MKYTKRGMDVNVCAVVLLFLFVVSVRSSGNTLISNVRHQSPKVIIDDRVLFLPLSISPLDHIA